MEALDDLLKLAEAAHGHLCAGQILGVRMAMLGSNASASTTPRQRPQAPRHLRRNRPLRHRRNRCRHRMPPRQARPQVPRLGQDGRHLHRPPTSNAAIRIAARESSKARARELYPRSKTRTSSRCAPTARCPTKSFSANSGCASTSSQRIPRLQRRTHRLRAMRRRHQLRPLHPPRQQILCLACADPESRYYRPISRIS